MQNEREVRRFLVRGKVSYGSRFFCISEREVWAETGNEAKQIFVQENSGDGFTCRDVVARELK